MSEHGHRIVDIQVRVFTTGEWSDKAIGHAVRFSLAGQQMELPAEQFGRLIHLGEVVSVDVGEQTIQQHELGDDTAGAAWGGNL